MAGYLRVFFLAFVLLFSAVTKADYAASGRWESWWVEKEHTALQFNAWLYPASTPDEACRLSWLATGTMATIDGVSITGAYVGTQPNPIWDGMYDCLVVGYTPVDDPYLYNTPPACADGPDGIDADPWTKCPSGKVNVDEVTFKASCPRGGTLKGMMCVGGDPCPNGGSPDGNGKCGPTPDSDNQDAGDNCTSTKKPISIGSGNKHLTEIDLTLPGLDWSRKYNSINADPVTTVKLQGTDPVMTLGIGWTANYSQKIRVTTSPVAALVVRPDGKILRYAQSASGAPWTSRASITATLTELKDSKGTRSGWQFVDFSLEHVETYDAKGVLQRINYTDGRVQTLSYSDGSSGASTTGYGAYVLDSTGAPTSQALPAGKLLRIQDQAGRIISVGYDITGHIVRVSEGAHVVHYTYDAASNLSTITYPDGSGKTYLYGESLYLKAGSSFSHVMTGILDENASRYASYWYDISGRAYKEQLNGAVGQSLMNMTLDAAGNVTQSALTDALGTTRTYRFSNILGASHFTGINQPGGSGCVAASNAVSYDANGNVSSQTDFNGNTTTYTYDLTRNLEIQRNEASSRQISTQWHPSWSLKTRIAEPKRITTLIYNGQPDPTNKNAIVNCAPSNAYIYGSIPIAVLCKKVEQATTDETGSQGFNASSAGSPRLWSFTYNQYGQILSAKGPRSDVNDTRTFTYFSDTSFDSTGNGHTQYDLKTFTDAVGQTTTYSSYDRSGQLQTLINPNSVSVQYVYALRGWLQSKSTSHNKITLTDKYTYDKVGQIQTASLSDGFAIHYSYDGAHRLASVSDNRGNSIAYTLDGMGNRIQEDTKDATGVLAQRVQRVFDQLGRLQNVEVQSQSTAETTLALSASATQIAPGASITFTAVLKGTNPTGYMTFKDGTISLGTVLMTNGQASLTTTINATGSHNILATYRGDANNTESVSPVVPLMVLQPVSLSWISPGEGVSPGGFITLKVVVKGSSPTGSVTMSDGSTVLGTATLENGDASLTTSFSTKGTHNITAAYSGDVNNAAGVSGVNAITVELFNPMSISISSSASSLPVGGSITLGATVKGTNPTGTITFMDGTTVLGLVPMTNGQASLTLTLDTLGTHNITAVYSGDANNDSITSSILALSVMAPTSVTLSASAAHNSPGQPVTYTATVSGNSPTGTVTFMDGTTSIGTASLVNGLASLTTTLTAGSHSITAAYSGDANNPPVTTNAFTFTTPPAAPGIGLNVNWNAVAQGISITLGSTVSGGDNPTGTVVFKDGSVTLGSAALVSGQANLTVISTKGSHSITATYSGDTNNASVTSPAYSFTAP